MAGDAADRDRDRAAAARLFLSTAGKWSQTNDILPAESFFTVSDAPATAFPSIASRRTTHHALSLSQLVSGGINTAHLHKIFLANRIASNFAFIGCLAIMDTGENAAGLFFLSLDCCKTICKSVLLDQGKCALRM
jgi:hypothetical protein